MGWNFLWTLRGGRGMLKAKKIEIYFFHIFFHALQLVIYKIVLNNFPSLFYCCLGTVESLADMMIIFPSLFYCCLGTVESLADMMVEGKILVIHPWRVGYPEKMRHDDDDEYWTKFCQFSYCFWHKLFTKIWRRLFTDLYVVI